MESKPGAKTSVSVSRCEGSLMRPREQMADVGTTPDWSRELGQEGLQGPALANAQLNASAQRLGSTPRLNAAAQRRGSTAPCRRSGCSKPAQVSLRGCKQTQVGISNCFRSRVGGATGGSRFCCDPVDAALRQHSSRWSGGRRRWRILNNHRGNFSGCEESNSNTSESASVPPWILVSSAFKNRLLGDAAGAGEGGEHLLSPCPSPSPSACPWTSSAPRPAGLSAAPCLRSES